MRARETNDPCHVSGLDPHSQQGRRHRDLVLIFMDALGGVDAVSDLRLVEVRKAAELTAAAEVVRADVLAGKSSDISALVKIEGEARRAVRSLGIKPGKSSAPSLAEHLAKRAAARASEPDRAA